MHKQISLIVNLEALGCQTQPITYSGNKKRLFSSQVAMDKLQQMVGMGKFSSSNTKKLYCVAIFGGKIMPYILEDVNTPFKTSPLYHHEEILLLSFYLKILK